MPYIVPQQPAPPTGFGQLVQGIGGGLDQVKDILLQAFISGQLTPKLSGGTQFTQASPGQGFPQVPLAAAPQTTRPVPQHFAGFQAQPNLARQTQQANLNNMNAQSAWYNRLANPSTPLGAGANTDALRQVADKADAGDPTAKAVMDYLLSHH